MTNSLRLFIKQMCAASMPTITGASVQFVHRMILSHGCRHTDQHRTTGPLQNKGPFTLFALGCTEQLNAVLKQIALCPM